MGLFNWPYSNLHELNLDWLISRVKELGTTVSDVLNAEYGLAAVESTHSNIDSYTQAELQALYDKGTNIIIAKDVPSDEYNNVLWIITKKGDTYLPIPYRPDTAQPGVLSVNGLTGKVRLSGERIPIYNGEYNSVYERIRQNERVHNIIDNGYFKDPVNQRGAWGATLASGYNMDRWRFEAEGGVVYTKNAYVTITGSQLTQYIPEPYNRGVVTLAVKEFGVITPHFCDLDTSVNGSASCAVASITRAETSLAVQLYPGKSYEWAALYEHYYVNDADLLATYMPKGYAVELAECQRYYYQTWEGMAPTYLGMRTSQALTSDRLESIAFPQKMRIIPTVSIYSPKTAQPDSVQDWVSDEIISGITFVYLSNNSAVPALFNTAFTPGHYYAYHYAVSADL